MSRYFLRVRGFPDSRRLMRPAPEISPVLDFPSILPEPVLLVLLSEIVVGSRMGRFRTCQGETRLACGNRRCQ